MANVLIVSGSYFPNATANAVCVKEFEKKLIEQGHNVYYAIKRHNLETRKYTQQDGIEIYHIDRAIDEFYSECEKLKTVNLPQPLCLMYRVGLTMIKTVMHLYSRAVYGSQRAFSEKCYLEEYAKIINEIVLEKKIDVIISVSMPFLSHKAVLRYLEIKKGSENKPKWMAYMIDAYSKKAGADGVEEKEKEEIEVIDKADRTMMLSILREDYSKEPFDKYYNKIEFVRLPLFNLCSDDKTNNSIILKDKFFDCVFAGTLYDDIRPISFFCDFVRALKNDKVRFHFMGKIYSHNLKILQVLQNDVDNEIIIYGAKPYEFAEKAIDDADIVINIGNSSINEMPSKIFSYMSRLKPILNFYRIENDTALPYLSKYPKAYNVYECKESLSEEAMDKVRNFITEKNDIQLTKEDLKVIFKGYTSEDVCNDFYELFCSI